MDQLIEVQVPQWRMYPAVTALMGLRGFQLVAAAVLVSELGDVRRFRHPQNLMAFLGPVPRKHTTGESRRLGAIPKTGNAPIRWILSEVVQHAYLPPKVSAALALRQAGRTSAEREHSWRIQVRLYKRAWALLNRKVIKAKVTIALAREMAGHVWAVLQTVPPPPP